MPLVKGYDSALLIVGGLWLLWRWRAGRPAPDLGSLRLPLIAFFGWLALSTIVAYDAGGAIKGLRQWVAHGLAFLMFIDVVETRREMAALGAAFLIGNTVLGVFCVWEYFSGVGRLGGPTETWPTVLGCYLNFALPWTLCMLYSTRNPNLRFFIAIVLLLLIFSLGGTLTRASLLGFLVSVLVLLGYLAHQKKWGIQAVLVALFLLLLLFPSFIGRLASTGPQMVSDIGYSRPVFWEQSLSLLDEGMRLLTGVGMRRSFHMVFKQQPYALVDSQFAHLAHAHNFLIHYLVIWGVPGLLAYLWFLGSYIKKLVESFRRNPSPVGQWIQWVALAALVGFWVKELFDVAVGFRTNMTCYWWTMAAGIVAGRLPSGEQAHAIGKP